jgi:uncharacterized membrane protein (UPF0127 family)
MKDDLPKKISEILGKNHRGCHYITSGGASFTVNIADDPSQRKGSMFQLQITKGGKGLLFLTKAAE